MTQHIDSATLLPPREDVGGAMNKYHNRRTFAHDRWFPSKAEAGRWGRLLLLEQAGEISCLEWHPRFVILPKDAHGRALYYEADSCYVENARRIVEDVKGGRATQTAVFNLKWRLAKSLNPGYEFRIVER